MGRGSRKWPIVIVPLRSEDDDGSRNGHGTVREEPKDRGGGIRNPSIEGFSDLVLSEPLGDNTGN